MGEKPYLEVFSRFGLWRDFLNDNKQLLDEVEHDSENYQGRGLCYLPKPKAEADNTNRGLDNFAIMRKPNPIIVLLYNYKCTSVETLSAKTRHTYMHKRQCL